MPKELSMHSRQHDPTPEKQERSQNSRRFFSGVFFLTLSGLLTKFCGLFLKVPLTNTLGDTGMAYFNLAYAVYKWFYMISTAGLPVAVAVLTAECAADHDLQRRSAALHRIRRLSLGLFCVVGGIGGLLMLAGAPLFAALQGVRDAALSIAAIAPALFFICIASALRGFYQGLGNLLPASTAQVVEAAAKMGCGLCFAAYALKKGYPLPTVAAYAIAGLSIGCFLGMVVMVVFLPCTARSAGLLPLSAVRSTPCHEKTRFLSRLWRIAVPVTLSASVMSLSDMLDSMIVIRRMCAAGLSEMEALQLYGNYSALAVPMFNLPPILIYPVTTALIPVITSACAEGRQDRRDMMIRQALSATAMIALPCAAGMSVMAEPLLRLLYRDDLAATGAPLLQILALAVFFLSMLAMTNAILQATDHARLPVYAMLAGAAVKLISNWILSGHPHIGIFGSPISTVLCYVTMACCNFIFVMHTTGIQMSLIRLCIKPGFASLLCAAAAAGGYRLLASVWPSSPATLTAVFIGGVVYCAALFLLGGVDIPAWKRLLKGKF